MTTLNHPETPARNGQPTPREQFLTPLANIVETAEGYVLEAEMPGVGKDGLELTVENGELTLVGRRPEPTVRGHVLHRESRPFHYRRVFELDPSIDATRITAKLEQGVVTLTLPKAESVKPRRIAVTD